MKFGLEERHWALIERLVLDDLRVHGAQIWVFGSRARGDYRPFSDLDLLYHTKQPLSLATIGAIAQRLEDSHLPIKVDLVSWDDLAQSYRPSVLKDRIQIYP